MYSEKSSLQNLYNLQIIIISMLGGMFLIWYHNFYKNLRTSKNIFILRSGDAHKISYLEKNISVNNRCPHKVVYNDSFSGDDTMIIDLLFSKCPRDILISGYFENIIDYEWIIRLSKKLRYRVYVLSMGDENELEYDFRSNSLVSENLYEVNDGNILVKKSSDSSDSESVDESIPEGEEGEGGDSEEKREDTSDDDGEEGGEGEEKSEDTSDDGVDDEGEESEGGDEGEESEGGDEEKSEDTSDEGGDSDGVDDEEKREDTSDDEGDEYDDGDKIVENNGMFSRFSWIYV